MLCARPARGVLGKHAVHEIVEGPGDDQRRLHVAEPRRLHEEMPREERGRVAVEGDFVGEELEEEHPEGIDVRRRRDVDGPARLLGRHVVRGPAHDAFPRQTPDTFVFRGAGEGQAEVDDHHARVLQVAFQHDVLGLEIPVHQAGSLRGHEHLRQLSCDVKGERDVEARQVLVHEPAEGLPLEELHGEEERVVVLAEVVDLDDPGMLQRREQPRLAEEAVPAVLVLRRGAGDDLEGHVAPERRLLGAVDGPHPAGAEHLADREALGDHGVRRQELHGRTS